MNTFRCRFAVVLLALVSFVLAAGPVLAGGGHGKSHDYEKTGPYDISLKTHPDASKIVPDKNLVETIISVTHNGKPAENVTLSYRLDAPPKRFWFGTDFPVVEGTPLLQGTVDVTGGNQVFDLVYPIRGNYTLRTKVTGPEGTAKKKFTITVSENPGEKMNLAIFLLVLFLVGGLGGYFLTGTTASRRTTAVIVLLGLGLVLFTPASALAHGKGAYNPDKLKQRIGTSGQTGKYNLTIRTFPQPVKVGEMLNVGLTVTESGDKHGHHGHESAGQYVADVNFIHSSGGKKFVGQSVVLHDNRASFEVQLFDGAPHFMLTRVYRRVDSHGGHGSAGEQDAGHHAGQAGHEEHGHERTEQKHAAGDQSGGHGHGPAKPWEWQGQVELSPGTYTIHFAESGDPSMKWLLVPAGTEHREERAMKTMKGSCKSVAPGTAILADDGCYNLMLNEEGTKHKLTVEDGGTYRLFTQHVPSEFDMTIESSEGETVTIDREFYPGKGELILTDVRKIEVQPVHPPVDDIVKVLLTLIGVAGLGFVAAWRLKVAMA